MPLYLGSRNAWPQTFEDDNGVAQDVSANTYELQLHQGCTSLTLSMGSGIEFETDGTDGVVLFAITPSQINQFKAGAVRALLFVGTGENKTLIGEGSGFIEGEGFDAR